MFARFLTRLAVLWVVGWGLLILLAFSIPGTKFERIHFPVARHHTHESPLHKLTSPLDLDLTAPGPARGQITPAPRAPTPWWITIAPAGFVVLGPALLLLGLSWLFAPRRK